MALRFRIFVRTVALLGALIVVSTVAIVYFITYQNRQYWDERCRQEVAFVAAQSEKLILWDDRMALQELLESLVASMGQIDYAFIERNGVPYAHTFSGGVPAALLGMGNSTGDVGLFTFKDENGSVFYDYFLHEEFSGISVHLGVSRYRVDRETSSVIGFVIMAGATLFLLSLVPGWIVSDAITREVGRINDELKRVNRELEMRVEDRTSDLRKSNEALTMEMSERKKLEKQRDDFLSMLRHDMRTPLTVIYGYSELLNREFADREDGQYADMVRSIMTSSRKLSRMVEDLSEMSRLESGSIHLEYGPVDLSDIVMETCLDFASISSVKGLSLKSDVPEAMPRIEADEDYVRRALTNLVSNALSYSPKGCSVTVSCGLAGEGPDRKAFVSVSDNGPGIAEGERERIFEKYYRSSGAETTSGKGLGLAIVKAVMDAHGGSIELYTERGKGSTFRLLFPMAAASGKHPAFAPPN